MAGWPSIQPLLRGPGHLCPSPASLTAHRPSLFLGPEAHVLVLHFQLTSLSASAQFATLSLCSQLAMGQQGKSPWEATDSPIHHKRGSGLCWGAISEGGRHIHEHNAITSSASEQEKPLILPNYILNEDSALYRDSPAGPGHRSSIG